jgi:hypothetical protein
MFQNLEIVTSCEIIVMIILIIVQVINAYIRNRMPENLS